MCGIDPVTALMGIGTALVGGMQSVAEYQGQKQVAAEARRSAIADHELKSTEINRRQLQEEDATAQKVALQNIESAQLASQAEVSAAAGGITGASVDNIVADIQRTGARNRETMRENQRMTAAQLQLEKKGSAAGAQSRINATPQPSKPALVAGIGNAALSGYNAYRRMS